MAKVSLANLSKSYRSGSGSDVAAVSGVTLEVSDRELLVLLGRTGAGKSTILRIIAGLEEVSSGDVSIGDRRVNDIAPDARDVALVTANHALYPPMTVRENLAIALKLRNFKESEITRRIDDAAGILQITDLLDRKPARLSRPESQRVAIARALVRQPKVILLDEPLAGLDTETRVQIRTEIAKLHQRRNATIVYATSETAEAMMLADRIAVLDKGAVQQLDSPERIYAAPANLIAAGSVGTPPMNLIHGTLKQERETLRFVETGDGSIELSVSLAAHPAAREFVGKPLVLGIRPEHISIAQTPKGQGNSATNFPAVAEIIEPAGAETLLHLQTGAHSIFCRSRGAIAREEAGRRMRFEIDPTQVHFFDPTTALRLVYP
jgi:multiple sugar transport system ATP-binding protein